MEISALFDSVDTAEFALVNLQGLGIFPERYKIRSTHNAEDRDNGFFTIAGAAANGPTAATPLNMNGGVAVIGTAYDNTAFGGGEPPNQEAQLVLTVSDAASARTQSALISNHGRRVRAL